MAGKSEGSNIYGKLAKVLAEVGNVPKTGWNDFHKYKYVTESDMVEHIRPLLAKHGIGVVVGVSSVKRESLGETRSGAPKFLVEVRGFMTFGADGCEPVRVPFVGHGEDPSDKGVYKAITGGIKYSLYKCFLVSTGDDPEATNGEREPTHKAERPRETRSAPAAQSAPTAGDAPPCPTCGGPTEYKPAGVSKNTGKEFSPSWRCQKDYKVCKGAVWIDDKPTAAPEQSTMTQEQWKRLQELSKRDETSAETQEWIDRALSPESKMTADGIQRIIAQAEREITEAEPADITASDVPF